MRKDDKNVVIVTASGVMKVRDLEEKLNDLFRQGYSLSGGITVLTNNILIAAVTKPF